MADQSPEQHEQPIYFKLSDQAIKGVPSPKTFKFKGSILGQAVSVLVDTGSSHNVLLPRLASHLHLPVQMIPNFSVMVGNGAHIHCSGYCSNTPLKLEYTFTVPFYVFDVHGTNVVLGLEWLRTLGSMVSDYSISSMSFIVDNRPCILVGRPFSPPLHNFCRYIQYDTISEFHTIQLSPPHDAPHSGHILQFADLSSTHPNLDPNLRSLLESFEKVFSTSHDLPPRRPHDHHITLCLTLLQ